MTTPVRFYIYKCYCLSQQLFPVPWGKVFTVQQTWNKCLSLINIIKSWYASNKTQERKSISNDAEIKRC